MTSIWLLLLIFLILSLAESRPVGKSLEDHPSFENKNEAEVKAAAYDLVIGEKIKNKHWRDSPSCRLQFPKSTGKCIPPEDDAVCFGQKIAYNYTKNPYAPKQLDEFSVLKSFPKCWNAIQSFVCSWVYRPCVESSCMRRKVENEKWIVEDCETWQVFPDDLCQLAKFECVDAINLGQWPKELKCAEEDRRRIFHPKCQVDPIPSNMTVESTPSCLWLLQAIPENATYNSSSVARVFGECYMPCQNPISSHSENLFFWLGIGAFGVFLIFAIKFSMKHRTLFPAAIVLICALYYAFWTILPFLGTPTCLDVIRKATDSLSWYDSCALEATIINFLFTLIHGILIYTSLVNLVPRKKSWKMAMPFLTIVINLVYTLCVQIFVVKIKASNLGVCHPDLFDRKTLLSIMVPYLISWLFNVCSFIRRDNQEHADKSKNLIMKEKRTWSQLFVKLYPDMFMIAQFVGGLYVFALFAFGTFVNEKTVLESVTSCGLRYTYFTNLHQDAFKDQLKRCYDTLYVPEDFYPYQHLLPSGTFYWNDMNTVWLLFAFWILYPLFVFLRIVIHIYKDEKKSMYAQMVTKPTPKMHRGATLLKLLDEPIYETYEEISAIDEPNSSTTSSPNLKDTRRGSIPSTVITLAESPTKTRSIASSNRRRTINLENEPNEQFVVTEETSLVQCRQPSPPPVPSLYSMPSAPSSHAASENGTVDGSSKSSMTYGSSFYGSTSDSDAYGSSIYEDPQEIRDLLYRQIDQIYIAIRGAPAQLSVEPANAEAFEKLVRENRIMNEGFEKLHELYESHENKGPQGGLKKYVTDEEYQDYREKVMEWNQAYMQIIQADQQHQTLAAMSNMPTGYTEMAQMVSHPYVGFTLAQKIVPFAGFCPNMSQGSNMTPMIGYHLGQMVNNCQAPSPPTIEQMIAYLAFNSSLTGFEHQVNPAWMHGFQGNGNQAVTARSPVDLSTQPQIDTTTRSGTAHPDQDQEMSDQD